MPADLESLVVLPNMHHSREKNQVFRLLWVMDLASDYSKCFVTLVFQNVNKKSFFFDTIPPELLCFCTVGSYYSQGKKFEPRKSDGEDLTFTIDSCDNNLIVPAHEVFSDREYDLSLNGKHPIYSEVCKNQLCFVQQVNDVKVVIPCFVLANSYYFRSTSLREAILSRKMGSLYHEYKVDDKARHAEIHLKQAGNIGDAKIITRFVHDDFARQRINLCKDHLYAQRNSRFKTIKIDFPVKEQIEINARGQLVTHEDGSKTFIVFQFKTEDSSYPFDTITIKTDEPEPEDLTKEHEGGDYPKDKPKKSGKRMNNKPYSENLVHQLIENSDHIENKNAEIIKVERIRNYKPLSEEAKKPWYEETDEEVELSTQPGSTTDTNTAGASIREKNEQERERLVSTLDNFKILVNPLRDHTFNIKSGGTNVAGQITNYNYVEDVVWNRSNANRLSLKESYDHSQANRRRCAYVTFQCLEKHVCLVEIDQESLSGSGLSTLVLISKADIDIEVAKTVVKGFVLHVTLADRAKELKSQNIALETKNHPSAYDEVAQESWRAKLIGIILGSNY